VVIFGKKKEGGREGRREGGRRMYNVERQMARERKEDLKRGTLYLLLPYGTILSNEKRRQKRKKVERERTREMEGGREGERDTPRAKK